MKSATIIAVLAFAVAAMLLEFHIERATVADAAEVLAQARFVDVPEPTDGGLTEQRRIALPYASGAALIAANPGCCEPGYGKNGDAPPALRIVTLSYTARYLDDEQKVRSIRVETYGTYDLFGRRSGPPH